jgi:hypothetical protein
MGVWLQQNLPPQIIIWVKPHLLYAYYKAFILFCKGSVCFSDNFRKYYLVSSDVSSAASAHLLREVHIGLIGQTQPTFYFRNIVLIGTAFLQKLYVLLLLADRALQFAL